MPIQEIEIPTVGRVNRRDPQDKLQAGDVRARENFYVIGVGDKKQNKKMPGSTRFVSGSQSAVGSKFTWLARYYNVNTQKWFGYNDGVIYHIDELGNYTSKLTSLQAGAYPSSTIMKVSGNNIMFMVDGFNGMYSHDGNIGQEWKKETSVTINFVYVIGHLSRQWGITEDSEDLYFSKTLVPTDFTDATDAGIITIGAKRGAKIQALAIINETLYIFKNDSIYVLEGRTTNEFRVREVHPTLGVASRFSVAGIKSGGVIFLGSDFEYHHFVGTQASTKNLSYNLAIAGDKSKDLAPIIKEEAATTAYGVFHNDLYRCAFTETGETQNKLEYIFNTTNLTDGLTRGNNVSCYAVADKLPDKGELITGRFDTGIIMKQWQPVLNWDHGQSGATMPHTLKTGFVRGTTRNVRYLHFWADINVLGANILPVDIVFDTRLRAGDRDEIGIDTQGETVTVAGLNFDNQGSMTERGTFPWSNGIGQSLSFEIDQDVADIDLSIGSFYANAIVKAQKRVKHVGI